jgi:hypothetical protein
MKAAEISAMDNNPRTSARADAQQGNEIVLGSTRGTFSLRRATTWERTLLEIRLM